MQKENAKLNIEPLIQALAWLISPRGGNNFLGRLLSKSIKSPTGVQGTLGVSLGAKGEYKLNWDSIWFNDQDRTFQIMLLIHEAGHLALGHYLRMHRILHTYKDSGLNPKALWLLGNVAADMAINDLLLSPSDLKNGVQYEKFFIYPSAYKLKEGESLEYYFQKLLQDALANRDDDGDDGDGEGKRTSKGQADGDGDGDGDGEEDKKGKGQGDGDKDKEEDTEGKGQGDGEDIANKDLQELVDRLMNGNDYKEFQEEDTEASIDRMLGQKERELRKELAELIAGQKSQGNVPNALISLIDTLSEEPTIPWKQQLQSVVGTAISTSLEASMSVPNMSMLHLVDEDIEPYPGYQYGFQPQVYIGIDTSGSVSNLEYVEFLTEIKAIMNSVDAEVKVVLFDAALQKDLLLEDTTDDREALRERKGYGGTNFTPFLKYCAGKDIRADWENQAGYDNRNLNNMVPDVILLFTDGYAPIYGQGAPLPYWEPSCPLIWVLTPNGSIDNNMENVIQIGV